MDCASLLLGIQRGRMLLRGALWVTVKCNYSTINLDHLLTYLAKPEQNGGSGRAFQKHPRHLGCVGLFSTLYLASPQESPACVWGGRGQAVCGEKIDALFQRAFFIFFFDCFLFCCLDQCWDQRHSDGTDKQLFFLWERRKKSSKLFCTTFCCTSHVNWVCSCD